MEGHRRLEERPVFGMAGELDINILGQVFLALISFIVVMDFMLHELGEYAKIFGLKTLYEMLKKELTMLGIISFLTFLYIDISMEINNTPGMYFFSFETMHIVLLFMAFAFIGQALLLLHFAVREGEKFLISHRISAKDLVALYDDMKITNPFRALYFHYAPSWMPTITSFRGDIENKIIEMHFRHIHDLDDNFPYAHYMSKLFQQYIPEVAEVKPLSWFILALLSCVNWIRAAIWPETWFTVDCNEEIMTSYDDDHHDERRMLGTEGDTTHDTTTADHHYHDMCYEFFFWYSLFVVFVLTGFLFTLYVFACRYHEMIVLDALVANGIDVTERSRSNHVLLLRKIVSNGQEQSSSTEGQISRLSAAAADLSTARPSIARPSAALCTPSIVDGTSAKRSSVSNRRSSHILSTRISRVSLVRRSTVLDKLMNGTEMQTTTATTISPMQAIKALSKNEDNEDGSDGNVEKEEDGEVADGEVAVSETNDVDFQMRDDIPPVELGDAVEMRDLEAAQKANSKDDKFRGKTASDELVAKGDGNSIPRQKAHGEKSNSFFVELGIKFIHHLVGERPEGKMEHIFLFGNSALFFSAVEVGLLLQNFYVAFWLTQLVPLFHLTWDEVTSKERYGLFFVSFFLSVPVVLNAFVTRGLLSLAVTLQAVCRNHQHVMGEVNEDAKKQQECIQSLRQTIRENLKAELEENIVEAEAMGIDTPSMLTEAQKIRAYKEYLKELFDMFDGDNDGLITQKEFSRLLEDQRVYMSYETFNFLWLELDYNLDGSVSWDILFTILFPELKETMKEELDIVKKLRNAVNDKFAALNLLTKADQVRHVSDLYRSRTTDGKLSSGIEAAGLMSILSVFVCDLDEAEVGQLLVATKRGSDGSVEWTEVRGLLLGIDGLMAKKMVASI